MELKKIKNKGKNCHFSNLSHISFCNGELTLGTKVKRNSTYRHSEQKKKDTRTKIKNALFKPYFII